MTTKIDKLEESAPPTYRPDSLLPPTGDLPPSYREGSPSSKEDLVPAGTLLLAGTTIFNAGAAATPPLYELTYAVGHLRESYTKVSFYRYEHKVSERPQEDASNPGPRITSRKKHIFDLRRDPNIMYSSMPYHLECVSRSGLANLGLQSYNHVTSKGVRAVRVTKAKVNAELEAGEKVFEAKKRGEGRHEWRDKTDGDTVVAHETAENGIYKLQIVIPMARDKRDALVATWCLRLWREIAMSKVEPLSWAQVKHVLQYDTKEFPIGTGWGI
ncbi:hypothetical protein CkaCkLH20_10722 [Colletotrichum karsti]|uniref:Uncharacterized protein n=1 Tax=Colletotrichum karsti TaxID=1095194 RepID=A0A9P6HVW9_9PEZI|nr:uncharacterized protein CkaCkLH20_10722 [Colletotrichum karsti]KAF9871788.1 hypothetical protein CkaCkLH20_10722 [Colletotrichum karsti]